MPDTFAHADTLKCNRTLCPSICHLNFIAGVKRKKDVSQSNWVGERTKPFISRVKWIRLWRWKYDTVTMKGLLTEMRMCVHCVCFLDCHRLVSHTLEIGTNHTHTHTHVIWQQKLVFIRKTKSDKNGYLLHCLHSTAHTIWVDWSGKSGCHLAIEFCVN